MATTLAERLRAARLARGFKQTEVAALLGLHAMSVSNWERGVTVPSDENLERLAELLGVSPARLRYGAADSIAGRRATASPEGVSQETREYTPNPALAGRLPPRAYSVVLDYLGRMERAGASAEQIDEAERLMIDGAFNKLHARDPRERTEDELIMDIDAAWDFIAFVLRRQGMRP